MINMDDITAIEQVVAAERQYRVRGANDALTSVYWPDATVHTSWQSGPISSFIGKGTAEMNSTIITRVSTPVVHKLSATRAYVEMPNLSDYWEQLHGVEVVLEEFMRLIYRVEKRDGEWRIADMLSIYEADKLTPAIPGTDLKIDPADVKDSRLPYRWMAYTRTQDGGQISQDLLGVDQKDKVAKVYAEAEAWAKQG
ncbi:hypothetical protein [Lacticaseibacillus hegangensis]|nr:hypothetical protein [Lacticaseibacillus hegangensis]